MSLKEPPAVCPKCGGIEGFDGPKYGRRASAWQPKTHFPLPTLMEGCLEYTCRRCGWVTTVSTLDAAPEPPPRPHPSIDPNVKLPLAGGKLDTLAPSRWFIIQVLTAAVLVGLIFWWLWR